MYTLRSKFKICPKKNTNETQLSKDQIWSAYPRYLKIVKPRRTPPFGQVVYKHLKNLKVSKYLLCIVHLLLGLSPFVRCLQGQDRYKVPLLLSFYSSFITTRDFTAKSHLQHYSCHTFNVQKHKKDMIVKVFFLFSRTKIAKTEEEG